jgi:hypothetical protein
MGTISSSETPVTAYKTIWRHNPKDHKPIFYLLENPKSSFAEQIEFLRMLTEIKLSP